jgi:hypothetical protein
MNKPDLDKLKRRLEKAVMDYTEAFCKKQGLPFDWWSLERIGTLGCFGNYYFTFDDIKYDMDTDQPKGLITQWQDECLEKGCTKINYYFYSKGIRP